MNEFDRIKLAILLKKRRDLSIIHTMNQQNSKNDRRVWMKKYLCE